MCAHKNYATSHLSGECKGSSFAVPISSQNGAPKVHTATEGPFCKVTSTVGVIFFSLSAFELVERKAGVAPDKRIEFRIGIHLGDVVEEADGDLMGDDVNIAARIEGVAAPGAICLSEDAYRQGSGPEFQQPSLLPIMSEASFYRPRATFRLR
jgi:hypothetical protein